MTFSYKDLKEAIDKAFKAGNESGFRDGYCAAMKTINALSADMHDRMYEKDHNNWTLVSK